MKKGRVKIKHQGVLVDTDGLSLFQLRPYITLGNIEVCIRISETWNRVNISANFSKNGRAINYSCERLSGLSVVVGLEDLYDTMLKFYKD